MKASASSKSRKSLSSNEINWRRFGCLDALVAPYPLLPHFPFPTTERLFGGSHRKKPPLRVVLALLSFLGWHGVLLGKELEFELWFELPKSIKLGAKSLLTNLLTFANFDFCNP
ncbi:hypothetical protein Tco_0953421 [Tanacetum coccineum]|uniref:Uncharacterized protein n=1 Tax=Tanacetum coccineum TaxID=301880 RepID=A0ABQ5DZU2_9ASTR